MSVTANGLPPGIGAPANNALGRAQRSSSGTHVEEENRLAVSLRLARVIVDDISNLLPLPVDLSCNVPVVSVERGLGTGNKLAKKLCVY